MGKSLVLSCMPETINASPMLERLVRLTKSFLGELGETSGNQAHDCLTEYLRAIDDLGCRDVRILRHVVDSVSNGHPPAVKTEPGRKVSSSVALVLAFLDQHYTESITWREVAASVRRNRAYLARRFRWETGATLRQYLCELRIHRAAQLIATGDKVEFIMLSVGYHSKRTFYSHFRAAFGVTPGAYRGLLQ